MKIGFIAHLKAAASFLALDIATRGGVFGERKIFKPSGILAGRCMTHDATAIAFRQRAGFPGEPNRSHPMSIEPCVASAVSPPTALGQAVIIDNTNQGVRPLGVADTGVTNIWGITVRSFPFQQQVASNYGAIGFGGGAPQTNHAIDVMKLGYIMAQIGNGALGTAVVKGGPVFVWIAASTGNHVQGGFEGVASAGNTIALDPLRYQWNGSADAFGVSEIIIKD